jgi:hypothetical protein
MAAKLSLPRPRGSGASLATREPAPGWRSFGGPSGPVGWLGAQVMAVVSHRRHELMALRSTYYRLQLVHDEASRAPSMTATSETWSIDVIDGEVAGVRAVVNPDKLAHLGPVGDAQALVQQLRARPGD